MTHRDILRATVLLILPGYTACWNGESRAGADRVQSANEQRGVITPNVLTDTLTTPDRVIGNAIGEELYGIRGAALLPSVEWIVVANGGSRELLFFDLEGHLQERAGGKGDGPGEFNVLSNLWRVSGDTLVAYDFRLQRFSVFTSHGTFARSWQWDNTWGGNYLQPVGAWRGSEIIAVAGRPLNSSPVPLVETVIKPVYVFDEDEGSDIPLDSLHSPLRFRSPNTGTEVSFSPKDLTGRSPT